MADDDAPNAPSSDYVAQQLFWAMVDAILAGADKMRATQGNGYSGSPFVPGPQQPVANLADLKRNRASGASGPVSPYLPRFPNETDADYETRRKNAPFTNIYSDVSENLAGKPFSKTLDLDEKTPDDLKKLAENIDGMGNSLHVFASQLFKAAVDKGFTWLLADYTKVPTGITLATEKALGARSYWVHIPVERMLAVYSDFLNGQEIIVHARIYEPVNRRVGYGEACVERVRILNREAVIDDTGKVVSYEDATWEVWEEQKTKDAQGKEEVTWVLVDSGPITIGIIPLIPIVLGQRDGMTWKVDAPLKDIAYMQVEEFQQESSLKSIKEMTAFPMLAGNGVGAPKDEAGDDIVVPVGPKAVLFAPMGQDGQHGEWKFIEPTAQSLTFLKDDLQALRDEMRDLGKQPLASANLTVITTANVAMRAHSAVQAWAIKFKDALEQAWSITCMWMNRTDKVEVQVHTDFGVDFEAGTELEALLKAQGQGVLSKKTVQSEFKRRGVLSDDFDTDEEEQQLAEEEQGLSAEQAIDPVTGEPVEPSTRPKVISGAPVAPPAAPKPPATVN